MELRVKCTYADLYLLQGGTLTKYAQFRGKNKFIGYWTGRSFDYNKRAYLEVKTTNTTFWVKKVAVNIIDNSNQKNSSSKSLLLLASLLLLLGD